ncbi:zinc finger and SCAN domain-containing protein 21-like [Coregonus clupeaformis]|uniref:zinc finger and SCAN domain-containing protein 21-like n=1 Tax=Coregonus clupeaformis TaxID=59861 RepID=UPI001E1C5A0F|nr:zinc finger and SCAN domain-containing protein 21-like [Coregonus clupeaformis]
MDEREDFVNIFQTQVKTVLDILLNVAVSEITHIFQGTSGNATIQNGVLPVALCAGDHATQTVQAYRLKNALERAICTHRETTEVTRRATQHDGGEALSGSVAMPRADDGEDIDIHLKDERLDWEVVKIGVFEEGGSDRLGNSMQQSEENECLVSEVKSEPSTYSEIWEPHCIHTEDRAATTLSLCSNDNVSLNSPTDGLTEQEMQVGTSQTPHPVPQKRLLFPLPISVSTLKEELKELDQEREKLESVPIAISTPVDSEQQPPNTLRTIELEPMFRRPVERLEALTDCDITGAALKVEPPGCPGPPELKEEEIVMVRHAAQQSTEQHNDNTATTQQLSTLQEPILAQENTHVHAATQPSTILNPAAKEEQRDRGGPVLRVTRSRKGCDTTSTALRHTLTSSRTPHRAPLTPTTTPPHRFPSTPPLLPHELEKQMRTCSVKLKDMRLVGQCHRRLRICWDCSKIFYRKRKLRRHRRLNHTGEKPYCCSQCQRAFSLRKNLKKHQRAHAGEKPYHCKDCGKQFRCNGKLKIHMRFHTGEKPFGCTLCGKKYRVLKNLERHMVTAHANPPPGQRLNR